MELDVHLLADGGLAIYHDNELPDGRAMRDLTLDDLPSGMPTLAQALAECAPMFVNVEIKAEGPAAEPALVREVVEAVAVVVAGRPKGQQIIISSFNWPALAVARDVMDVSGRSGVTTAMLAVGLPQPQDLVAKAVGLGCSFVHPWHPETTAPLVASAHAADLGINVWTANHPDLVRQLMAMKVDGIITDEPGACREALRGR